MKIRMLVIKNGLKNVNKWNHLKQKLNFMIKLPSKIYCKISSYLWYDVTVLDYV